MSAVLAWLALISIVGFVEATPMTFITVQMESCTPGTLLLPPVNHLWEPTCLNPTQNFVVDLTEAPAAGSLWPTSSADQLYRFSHNIFAPIPATTGFILRVLIEYRPPNPVITDESPRSPRAVGVCLRRNPPPSGTVLQLSPADSTVTPVEGISGFCQVPDVARANFASITERDPPPDRIRFANPGGIGFQMKRTSTSGPFTSGHLCAASGGSWGNLRATDAVSGPFQDAVGGNTAIMAFTGPTQTDCAQSAAVGMPSGAIFPEEQAYGFHITCEEGSLGTTAFAIFSFLGTLTLDVPTATRTVWDPITQPGVPSTWPFAVVSAGFTCAGPANITAPGDIGAYLGPTNASTFCGAQVCPPFKSLSSAIPGVTFFGSCRSCTCETLLSPNGPVTTCTRGRDADVAEEGVEADEWEYEYHDTHERIDTMILEGGWEVVGEVDGDAREGGQRPLAVEERQEARTQLPVAQASVRMVGGGSADSESSSAAEVAEKARKIRLALEGLSAERRQRTKVAENNASTQAPAMTPLASRRIVLRRLVKKRSAGAAESGFDSTLRNHQPASGNVATNTGTTVQAPRASQRAVIEVRGCEQTLDPAQCCIDAFREIHCGYGYELEICYCNRVGQVTCPNSNTFDCPDSKKGLLGLLGLFGIIPILLAICALWLCISVLRIRPKRMLPREPISGMGPPPVFDAGAFSVGSEPPMGGMILPPAADGSGVIYL